MIGIVRPCPSALAAGALTHALTVALTHALAGALAVALAAKELTRGVVRPAACGRHRVRRLRPIAVVHRRIAAAAGGRTLPRIHHLVRRQIIDRGVAVVPLIRRTAALHHVGVMRLLERIILDVRSVVRRIVGASADGGRLVLRTSAATAAGAASTAATAAGAASATAAASAAQRRRAAAGSTAGAASAAVAASAEQGRRTATGSIAGAAEAAAVPAGRHVPKTADAAAARFRCGPSAPTKELGTAPQAFSGERHQVIHTAPNGVIALRELAAELFERRHDRTGRERCDIPCSTGALAGALERLALCPSSRTGRHPADCAVLERAGHVAGHQRLRTGVIRQDAGEDAVGLLDALCTCPDHDELADDVQRCAVRQLELRVHDDGDVDEEHAHRDDRGEHGQELHDERRRPLLELLPVIQRHGRHDRRRDEVHEQQVEDADDAVDDDERHIDDQDICAEIDDQIVRLGEGDVKILIDRVQIIDGLLSIIIGAAHVVEHVGGLIVHVCPSGGGIAHAHRSDQEEGGVERDLRAVKVQGVPVIALERVEIGIGL